MSTTYRGTRLKNVTATAEGQTWRLANAEAVHTDESGQGQLAFAIALDATRCAIRARATYPALKAAMSARWNKAKPWEITADEVLAVIVDAERLAHGQPARRPMRAAA